MKKNKKRCGGGEEDSSFWSVAWDSNFTSQKSYRISFCEASCILAYWFRDREERRSTEKRRKWFRVNSYSR